MVRKSVKSFLFLVLLIGVIASNAARAKETRLLTLYWPPFINKAPDGKVIGVAPAIVKAILSDAGIELKPELLPWPRVYKNAQKKRNILVFSMVRFPEREKLFHWLSPLFISEQGVLVYNRDHRPVQPKTIDELRKVKLCVTTGNTFYVKLRALGFEPGKNLFEFETLFPDGGSRQQWYLFHPQCDFKVTNWAAVTSLLRQRGFKEPEKYIAYYPVPEKMLGNDMQAYLAASMDFEPKALEAIKRSSIKLRKDGTLLSICKKEYKLDDKTCSMLMPER